jgi:DNA polymerase-3 subunit epsilon
MSKVLWFDTETTGIDPKAHSVVQIAGIIEIDGKIKEEFNLFFQPLSGRAIELRALEVNNRTESELLLFPPAAESMTALKAIFDKYINKRDRRDKFVAAGFNVNFDLDFLRETWFQASDKYGPGSYMFNCPWDVRSDVARLIVRTGLRLKDYKLGTICGHFGIDIAGAHNAIVDVRATRELAITVGNILK